MEMMFPASATKSSSCCLSVGGMFALTWAVRFSRMVVLTLGGCTAQLVAIDYTVPPPADWPRLEEKVDRIAPEDLPKYCSGLGAAVSRSVSCAVTSFRRGICYIYLTRDDPDDLEHERAHCAGYGHVGDAWAPARAWERFKAAR